MRELLSMLAVTAVGITITMTILAKEKVPAKNAYWYIFISATTGFFTAIVGGIGC